MPPKLKYTLLAIVVLIGVTVPLVARAQDPVVNLLSNAAFEPGSASGSASFTGQGPGPSVVADWEVFNNTQGTTKTTLLRPATPGGHSLLHVTTDGLGNGLVNVFLPSGAGPMQSVSFVRVFVVRGRVAIGTGNGGLTGFNAFTRTIGAWEIPVAIHTGSPANEFIVYAASVGGAEFYLDRPHVLAVEATGAAPGEMSTLKSGGACDGVFGGIFEGDITVSAGQTCVLVEGTITGNVRQRGGTLILAGDFVAGNVQVNGGTFSIGPVTNINGNLQVQNLSAGPALNQLCDSVVHGEVLVHNSGTAVRIGSGVPWSCPGNFLSGNLLVDRNDGTMSIAGNTIRGNLQCNGNTGCMRVVGNTVGKQSHCEDHGASKQDLSTALDMQSQCVGH